MRDPPQNQASSMKRATCQGHSCSSASCPPTILPARAGPSIPQVAFRSTLVPFLVDAPVFSTSLVAQARFSAVAGTVACLGLYLLRSRPWAGLQCSSLEPFVLPELETEQKAVPLCGLFRVSD